MADAPEQRQQIQLRIDESRMATTYANTIRTSTTGDEVLLDFGINLPVPTNDNSPALLFTVNSRVVVNWKGAKRLAIQLGQIIREFEKTHGEIPLNAPQAGGQAGGGPRLAD